MTVTNTDIVKFFQKAVKEKWGYVWCLNGVLYTQEMAEKFKKERKSTPRGRTYKTYWTEDCKQWIGKMAADCSGGIVAAIRTKIPTYTDRTANTFRSQFSEYGKISTIPEIPGLAVWRNGHIGIYEGNGYVLEFRGTAYGAVRTKLADRGFNYWGKIRDVDYSDAKIDSTKWNVYRLLKYTKPMLRGDDVKELQTRLNAAGFDCGKIDGIFGKKTEAAVMAYQKAKKLTVDGKAGKNTITKLGGVWRG